MLLKDNALQKRLERDGFAIIQFLNSTELRELNSFYNELHNGGEPPLFIENIHMTSWCTDANYKDAVSTRLATFFGNPGDRFFKNYRRLNHVFIVKRSGDQTTFKVHQDWNVVDESKYQSVNVWVPLHDVDENSGALWVLKGSHKINRKIRGAGCLFPDYTNFNKELQAKAVSVKLKAGQAIVFYHSVIHGSPPNLSGAMRRAACFSVIPKEAPLCIYFQASSDSPLERHQPKDDFMFNYAYLRTETYHTPPSPTPVETMAPYVNKKVEWRELEGFLNEKWRLLSFIKRRH